MDLLATMNPRRPCVALPLHRHLRRLADDERGRCTLRVIAGVELRRYVAWSVRARTRQRRHHDTMTQVVRSHLYGFEELAQRDLFVVLPGFPGRDFRIRHKFPPYVFDRARKALHSRFEASASITSTGSRFPTSLAMTRVRFFPVSALICHDPAVTRCIVPLSPMRAAMPSALGFYNARRYTRHSTRSVPCHLRRTGSRLSKANPYFPQLRDSSNGGKVKVSELLF